MIAASWGKYGLLSAVYPLWRCGRSKSRGQVSMFQGFECFGRTEKFETCVLSLFPPPPRTHPARASATDFFVTRVLLPRGGPQPRKATRNRQPQPVSRVRLVGRYSG